MHKHLVRILAPAAAAMVVATLGAGIVLQTQAGAAPQPPYNTTTAVVGSPKSLVTGQAVTYTATVKSSVRSAPTPYGRVVFTITGGGGFTGSCNAGNTVTLSSGTAQCSIPGGLPSSRSPFTVSAAYTDNVDTHFNPSSTSLSQAVAPGGTATSVTSSSNPSVSGQPVTFVATVGITSPARGTLTGAVTFSGVTCNGGNTVALSSNMASCSVPAGLSAGASPYSVTATYGSDPNFANSTSAKLKQVVDQAAATVVLSANPNDCSGDVCTVPAGTPISFKATVTSNSPSTGTPNGSVVFTVQPAGQTKSKNAKTCDGGNTVALSGTPGDDTATCSFSGGLPASVYYTITATLSDPNYAGTSAALYETSGQLSTNTQVSHPSGISAGETFDVTAAVTAVGSPSSDSPTGDVEITVCGSEDNGNNGCQGTPEPVDPGTGIATLVVGGGEYPGEYKVYAEYLGDQNYLPSTSSTESMHIGLAPTQIAVVSSENPSIGGDAVTLTAEVTATGGSAGSTLVGPPTGAVTFTVTDPNGGTYSCDGGNSVELDNGPYDEGVAQCYLPSGTLNNLNGPNGDTDYNVKVSYPSDGDFQSSMTNYTQTVVPPAGD
jgi:Bacterial Ig-like domain (group 3)